MATLLTQLPKYWGAQVCTTHLASLFLLLPWPQGEICPGPGHLSTLVILLLSQRLSCNFRAQQAVVLLSWRLWRGSQLTLGEGVGPSGPVWDMMGN